MSIRKILHICNDYYNTSLYRNLIQTLNKNAADDFRSDMYVFTLKNEKHTCENDVTPVSILKKWYRLFYWYKLHKSIAALTKVADINTYSIVHAHFLFTSGSVAYALKKKHGLPYITAVRNVDLNVFFRYMFHLRQYGIRIMENADRIVFISETYKRATIEKYVPKEKRESIYNKSIVLPNGIDSFWHENRVAHTHSTAVIRLIFVGTVDKNKNCQATIDAAQILRQRGYDVTYTIVGRIIDKTYFDKLIRHEWIQYIPQKSKEELAEIYKNHDIFVMPSKKETFGLVYAEAMSQGLPVIYSRGQGFDEQFPDGEVGYAVDSMNSTEIAEKILLICNNYDKMSKNCTKKCVKFDWSAISRHYITLYNEVIGMADVKC